MSKVYFTPATFRFLRALDRHNSREWFAAHKDDYERHVREPFLALITDMQAPLSKISAHYRAKALELLQAALELTPAAERGAFRRTQVQADPDLSRFAGVLRSK